MEGKKLRGVYSTETPLAATKGLAVPREPARRLWVVWDNDEKSMLAQPLNQNLIPSGAPRAILLKDFLERYRKEPDYVINTSSPEFDAVWKAPQEEPAAAPPPQATEAPAPDAGEPHVNLDAEPLDLTDPLPAQTPAPSAAVPDAPIREIVKNMQADFADGLEHLKSGHIDEAVSLFENLADIQADFTPEHKHMFNGFGIDLRKNKIFDLALKHYTKALDLSPSDENLYHNIARVYYEKGDLDQALKNLEKSLEINPGLRESELFWDYIIQKRRKLAKAKYSMEM